MPLDLRTGPLGRRGAAHLLRRATFGPTMQDIETFSSLTATEALNRLFRPSVPLPNAPAAVDPDNGDDPWVITGNTAPDKMEFAYQENFKQWFIGQMMSAGVPVSQSLAYSAREKIVFFFHTHITAISEKIGSSRAMYFQNQLLRLYAFDDVTSSVVPADKLNFKELTKKICVDNAMLNLLDGTININGGNENFGRELLELYTIGRGLEGIEPIDPPDEGEYLFYTEDDVQAAAKIFSGFQFDPDFAEIDPDTELPRGKIRGSKTNASAHNNTSKALSSKFGTMVSIAPDPLLLNGTNATEESALDEINRFIDLIYNQQETALHICRKIYRFFMYHEITEAMQGTTGIITEMAETFRTNGFKIQPVIERLLSSVEFYSNTAPEYDDDAFGGIIKSPLDLIIGTYRFFGVAHPSMSTNSSGFYSAGAEIISRVKLMGMDFYQPFDVAGYDAYHQYPIYHRSWITVNNLTNRYDFIDKWLPSISVYQFVRDNIDFGTASNARTLVVELASLLLPVTENLTFDPATDDNSTLRAERLLYFLDRLVDIIDMDPEAMWTQRYTNEETAQVESQLRVLINAMLQSPEYQLQ